MLTIIHTFLYRCKVVTSEAVYSPAFAGTKLYCLVTEAHRLAQIACPRPVLRNSAKAGLEPTTYEPQVQCPTDSATMPPNMLEILHPSSTVQISSPSEMNIMRLSTCLVFMPLATTGGSGIMQSGCTSDCLSICVHLSTPILRVQHLFT